MTVPEMSVRPTTEPALAGQVGAGARGTVLRRPVHDDRRRGASLWNGGRRDRPRADEREQLDGKGRRPKEPDGAAPGPDDHLTVPRALTWIESTTQPLSVFTTV